MARLDGPAREVRLLVDHREDLVAERTRIINRLRWHLHELDPTWDPPAGSMARYCTLDRITARLVNWDGTVARIAGDLTTRARALTVTSKASNAKSPSLSPRWRPRCWPCTGSRR